MTVLPPVSTGCAFCEYIAGSRPCAFIRRTELVSSFVNLRQYERGAALIVPNMHFGTVLDIDGKLLGAIYNEAAAIGRALVGAFSATGLNIFQNSGIDAGQTEPHFHVHVVPRYPGSDPSKIFRSAEVEPVSMEVQLGVAASIAGALNRRAAR